MVESCINDLKGRLIQAGLLKVGTPSGVTDALLFGAIMALSGFDAASKLAGPGSSDLDSGVRLQACNVAKQALDKYLPGASTPPAPTVPPVMARQRMKSNVYAATAAAADTGFKPLYAVLGISVLAVAAGGFLLLRR
jgi:hypothetical protein